MAKKQVHSSSDQELVQKLAESRDSLFKLRFQNATGQLDDSSQIKKTRREIAQLETIVREREITKVFSPSLASSDSKQNETAEEK